MKINDFLREAPDLLDSGVSIELTSAPGIGKSEGVDQLLQRMRARDGADQWGFATMFLATQTPPDLIGYQFKSERMVNGELRAVTDPSMPLWMTTVDGKSVLEYPRGILFLDEYGQGEADVKRASAELLLKGAVGPWKLPKGWSVIAASNRANDRSGVTKSFDFVINRRVEIHIDADVGAWETWAFKNGVDPVLITFAVQNPNIVFAGEVPDKQGPWCTPRSLVLLDRMLRPKKARLGHFPDDPVTTELATGMIGPSAASQLMATIRLSHAMPKYADIIANPKTAKKPDAPDAQMLVVYELAGRVDESDVDPIIQYVDRFPAEFGVTFTKAAVARNPMLINTNAFGGWCQKNASLMSAIINADD
jgi:hypothetical protein